LAGFAQKLSNAITPARLPLSPSLRGRFQSVSSRRRGRRTAFARNMAKKIGRMKNLLTAQLHSLNGKLTARLKPMNLPFGPQFTGSQWKNARRKPASSLSCKKISGPP